MKSLIQLLKASQVSRAVLEISSALLRNKVGSPKKKKHRYYIMFSNCCCTCILYKIVLRHLIEAEASNVLYCPTLRIIQNMLEKGEVWWGRTVVYVYQQTRLPTGFKYFSDNLCSCLLITKVTLGIIRWINHRLEAGYFFI